VRNIASLQHLRQINAAEVRIVPQIAHGRVALEVIASS
jgi:hypothetical protein